jgi:hypothetical protein
MLKLLLKIWPALIPITVYIFWVLVIDRWLIQKILKKDGVIEGEKVVGEKSTEAKKSGIFSLQNRCFVIILYMTLILGILILISFALSK